MTGAVAEKAEPTFAELVPQRGYNVLYRRDQVNHCPGCGGTQWWVGRSNATCAYETCGTPLDFAEDSSRGAGTTVVRNLHIPEKRDANPGTGTIFRKNFHVPSRREL